MKQKPTESKKKAAKRVNSYIIHITINEEMYKAFKEMKKQDSLFNISAYIRELLKTRLGEK